MVVTVITAITAITAIAAITAITTLITCHQNPGLLITCDFSPIRTNPSQSKPINHPLTPSTHPQPALVSRSRLSALPTTTNEWLCIGWWAYGCENRRGLKLDNEATE